MVTHIVFWNYKEELSADQRTKAFQEMKDALISLKGKIDGLQHIELGANFTEGGCDLALYTQLESKEALSAYQVHPDHVAAASVVMQYVQDRKVVDFETL